MKNAILLLLAVALCAQTAKAQNVGDVAPDFTLEDLNSRNYTLSNNRDKVIFIFFVGYNCPLCIASAPTVKSKIIDVYDGRNGFEALVIDVYNGSASSVGIFKSSTDIDAIYLQKGSTVANNYGSGKDRLVVIDSNGKIAFKGRSAASSDANAAATAIDNALREIITSVDVRESEKAALLSQNYPNPFSQRTRIRFSVDEVSEVALSILDITGKKISIPVNREYQAGTHEIELDLSDWPSGTYFYRIESGNMVRTRKMLKR